MALLLAIVACRERIVDVRRSLKEAGRVDDGECFTAMLVLNVYGIRSERKEK